MVSFEENRDMATTHRRHTTTTRNSGSDLREDVREAIERAWPDGVVEMAFDSDESWFHDVYAKLASAFRRIKSAQLAHERKSAPVPVRFDDSDDDEDRFPDDPEPSRSYHLFFVYPEGDAFNYETEIEVSPNHIGMGTKTRVRCSWKQLPEAAEPAGQWPYP